MTELSSDYKFRYKELTSGITIPNPQDISRRTEETKLDIQIIWRI